ncbi:nuclease-related domain-containing protein [Streptomyces sp. TRM49041]|uniref:nuclease-related domain-containing protein n=1 Tax=Streptomyces sp. TRM49041 TaxID=2603216 RepID=UPI0011F04637|nr:nuclease-related domain-containing protein [Streptomyces sp. TRM49041]
MTALLVTPVGERLLFVGLRDGRGVAWYEKERGRISLLDERYADEVRAALAPYVTGEVTIGPPPVPTASDLARLSLHPDDDLAPNRPGEPLLTAPHGRRGRLRRDPYAAELAAQQKVGDALDRLHGAGWRVLHAIPLPGTARIDHLAIGPGGTLVVRTLAARRSRVRITDPDVTVGRGTPRAFLRRLRQDADRAAHALATAVRPLLAVADATRLPIPPGLQDVRIARDDQLPSLARLGGVLKPTEVESLYTRARNRHTWLTL